MKSPSLSLRMVRKMDENEVRVLGYCAECNSKITDEHDVYVDEDGNYFDDIECVLSFYNIHKLEA